VLDCHANYVDYYLYRNVQHSAENNHPHGGKCVPVHPVYDFRKLCQNLRDVSERSEEPLTGMEGSTYRTPNQKPLTGQPR
jgi:hypothetical protein